MMCLIKQDPAGKITGWIFGTDIHDLRRKAQSIGEMSLAAELYRHEFQAPGRTDLAPGLALLAD